MTAPFVRSPYNYDMNKAGDQSGLKCQDKSLAQQHMKDECDINYLMERYTVTGEVPQLVMPPLQGDFTNAPTYQEALNRMIEADRAFMQMPAKIRNQFENDAGQFVAFCSDEKNRDQLRQWGLWSPEANAAYELRAKQQKEALDAAQRDAELYRASQGGTKPPKKDDKGVI